jgi:serine/threonine protein kinase
MKTGQRIGRFELLERVGQGGMAEIFRASERLPSGGVRTVAIKRLFAKLAADHRYVEMFVNEASIAARMQHPNIVRTYGLVNYQAYYYIVMEYLAGIDLHDLLSCDASVSVLLTIPQATFIAHEVASGLAYAHRGGAGGTIIHRDVSPGNILIGSQGAVKIADFGIAKVLQAVSQTLPGIIKGTYEYMAPEYVKGLPFDGRADLFSLGVVLYQMLTGVSPFIDDQPRDIWENVMRFDPPPPSKFVPAVPAALDALLSKALAKSPLLRVGSAEEFAENLEPFFEDLGSSVVARQLAERVNEHIQQHRSSASPGEAEADEDAADRSNQELEGGELLDLIEPVDDSHSPTSNPPMPSALEDRRPRRWPWMVLPLLVVVLVTVLLLLWPQRNGLISVTADVPATVSIDGQLIGTAPLRLSLSAEMHAIEIRCPSGGQANRYQVVIESKREMQLTMKCKKPNPSSKPIKLPKKQPEKKPEKKLKPKVTPKRK